LFFSLFIIYLQWFHKITIKYSSIGLGDIENLDINHRLFHLHIKNLHFILSFPIFIFRLPIISINNIHLKIYSIKTQISNQNQNWNRKFYLLKVNIFIKSIKFELILFSVCIHSN